MSKNKRIIISVLALWSFIHVVLFFLGGGGLGIKIITYMKSGYEGVFVKNSSQFFPFESDYALNGEVFVTDVGEHVDRLQYYDITEFLVYAITPWLIFVLYNFIQKGK